MKKLLLEQTIGTISDADRKILYKLIDENPDEFYRIANTIIASEASGNVKLPEENKVAILDAILQAVSLDSGLVQTPSGTTGLADSKRNPSPLHEETVAVAQKKYRKLITWKWVAAAVFILALSGIYFFYDIKEKAPQIAESIAIPEVLPGKSGAILRLEDGTEVNLDAYKDSVMTLGEGVIAKTVDGCLIYEENNIKPRVNTVVTPNGRRFSLFLPDGTLVWLNAGSSISFPTSFIGDYRFVTVVGEAYFEVKKSASQPFIINVNNQAEVEVLGTSFNVNAYENESTIQTTVLDGAVAVSNNVDKEVGINQSGQNHKTLGERKSPSKSSDRVVLRKSQQAIVQNTHASLRHNLPVRDGNAAPIKLINNVDVNKVIAWKSGIFNFNDVSLKAIMKQLERWYDIEVEFAKGVPDDIYFVGEMSSELHLSTILEALSEMEVHFRIDSNKKVTVLP